MVQCGPRKVSDPAHKTPKAYDRINSKKIKLEARGKNLLQENLLELFGQNMAKNPQNIAMSTELIRYMVETVKSPKIWPFMPKLAEGSIDKNHEKTKRK